MSDESRRGAAKDLNILESRSVVRGSSLITHHFLLITQDSIYVLSVSPANRAYPFCRLRNRVRICNLCHTPTPSSIRWAHSADEAGRVRLAWRRHLLLLFHRRRPLCSISVREPDK